MTRDQQDLAAEVGCGCLCWLPWLAAIGIQLTVYVLM